MVYHLKNRNFDARFAMAADALAAGFTTEAAKKAAIDNLTTALEVAVEEVREVLLGEARDEASTNLYYDLPSYPHEWTPKKRAAYVERFPVMVEKLDRVRALRDAIKAAEVVKAERQPTPAQARKLARSMTCQCCGRAIFAETGVIAHHGYERPGYGYQTPSCEGARELPFEVSRDALGRHIENLKAYRERQIAYLAEVRAERAPVAFNFTDYTRPTRLGGGQPASRMVTRETFPAVWEETLKARRYVSADERPNFDRLKAKAEGAIEADIAATADAIRFQTERFNGWKQTHRREGEKWVAL